MVVTEELAFRVERSANEWGRSWMAGIAGLRLGPFAPHLLAPCHPDRPDLDFQNRVNGLTPADAHLVAAIVDWYAGHGIRPWFELVPTHDAGELLAALDATGAAPIGYHGLLVGRPDASSPPPAGADSHVDVVEVDPADDVGFATFARVRTEAHELPPEVIVQAAADLAGWRQAPRATLYLATVDGVPAATAALSVSVDGVGYLADGATVPAFRGRGLQAMLIERRKRDATAAGCDVVASQASLGSSSSRNLQRAGLASGATKLVLRVRDRMDATDH